MVLVRLDNNSVLWKGQRPMNQDFITFIISIFSTCPFVLQGEHLDLFIQYPMVKEIEPVDRVPSTLLFSR
jgi:hypothetical protein